MPFSFLQKIAVVACISSLFFLQACQNETTEKSTTEPSTPKIATPIFNEQNALVSIKTQVAFGPRVPGTQAQKDCAAWMQTEFEKYADTVYIQSTTVTQPVSQTKYPCINIIASFNPKVQERVLLLAHWDSRPWADEDTQNKTTPIDAADDGASGVAVLLEIASHLKTIKPTVGVDILLVDAEDEGKNTLTEDSYCLGTQYWARNKHVPNYKAMFGICLDMVGAKGAQFPLEINSTNYAGTAQKEIWNTAQMIGYGHYFVNAQGGQITDDHLVINTLAQIPCVDIINLQPNQGFGKHWHTHQDNITIIDPATLKAVGQTVMQVIYNQ